MMRRLDMMKTKQILRLRYKLGLSLREIGQACNCGTRAIGPAWVSCSIVPMTGLPIPLFPSV